MLLNCIKFCWKNSSIIDFEKVSTSTLLIELFLLEKRYLSYSTTIAKYSIIWSMDIKEESIMKLGIIGICLSFITY